MSLISIVSNQPPRNVVWGPRRVFVSPALGCPAACAFCYLPSHGEDSPTGASQEDLVASIENDDRFSPGAHGTLVSLGCLSECLAPHSRAATLSFLERIQHWRNPVQLATRWIVPPDVFGQFLAVAARCGLVLFHSMSTISRAREFEQGTASVAKRREFLELCVAAGLQNIIYVKPFIAGVTSGDTEEFVSMADRYRPDAFVVGPLFVNRQISHALSTLAPAAWAPGPFSTSSHPVSSAAEADEGQPGGETQVFIDRLISTGVPVYLHSTEFFSANESLRNATN